MTTKIAINLLPPEIIAQEAKKAKFYKIQLIGIGVVLVMFFLTSITLTLQILQNRNIEMYKARVTQAESRVVGLQSSQASLIILKDRLNVIEKYMGVPSKQSSTYQMIEKLIPQSIAVNSISIGEDGEAVFQVVVPDFNSLDSLMNNLTMKEKNDDAIAQVSIESLNRGRDGVYRMGLKVKPK